MTEWFYKATATKVSYEETRDLAMNSGFICRSAYEDNGARADNTQHVKWKDIIHLYFTGRGDSKVIGSFEVVGPARHPKPESVGRAIRGTALHECRDDFANKLVALGTTGGQGYAQDPVLKKLTGWLVLRRDDLSTPALVDARFRNQATLVRRSPRGA